MDDKKAVAAPLKAVLPPCNTGNAPKCLPQVPQNSSKETHYCISHKKKGQLPLI